MSQIDDALKRRFGPDTPATPALLSQFEFPAQLAGRRSHRKFKSDPLEPGLIRSLCALALCAPAKSDLQQRDIIIIEDPDLRAKLMQIIPGNDWMNSAPAFLVFCANNRRQRQINEWRGPPFVNDHLDAFFNASVDAGIALTTFMMAAESIGLGCCPISAIRNESQKVSDLLGLPDHVFAVAGLALGWPAQDGWISMRLPLGVTVHTDRFSEDGLSDKIDAYDHARDDIHSNTNQRNIEEFGRAEFYGWSEDKARQYSQPDRENFGDFIRAKGFNLS
jgi:nitroreductase/FMN reductase [NAD(P)H]